MNRKLFSGIVAALMVAATLVLSGVWYYTSPTIAFAQVGASSTSRINTSNWKTYRSQRHGFEVKYPNGWSVHETSGSLEGVLICKTPQPDSNAGVQFGIQRQANPGKLSIEKWFANELQRAKATRLPEASVTIGGRPAIRIQVGESYEIVTRLNATDILSILYPPPQPKSDETYAAILSTFKFL